MGTDTQQGRSAWAGRPGGDSLGERVQGALRRTLHRARCCASLALLASVSACISTPAVTREAAPGMLSALEGRWAGPMWGGVFEAVYTSGGGHSLLSHSRLRVDGETTFYEFEVFEQRGGRWTLQPYPMGKPAVEFALIASTARSTVWVFENEGNDFPTRVVYDASVADRLTIVLTDPFRGSPREERFVLERQP